MKFISEWKRSSRLWSVQLSAAGATLMTLFTFWPDSALQLWAVMPDEVRAMIPQRFVSGIAAFIFAMTVFARIIKQGKKDEV